jgi:diadenylate cyclase
MDYLHQLGNSFKLIDIVDILLVSVLIYYFLLLIQGTRAVQILQGVLILLVILLLSYYFKFRTIYWLLHYLIMGIIVALPIVFQPELRRALGLIGRRGMLSGSLGKLGKEALTKMVDEICWTVSILSQTKTGAIIVLERETGLEEFIETGIRVNADVSSKLLLSIFMPKSPLHDGAVIVRGDKVVAANCYLPLSSDMHHYAEMNHGTRHRAGLGLSEETDALIIIVSEETGKITLAKEAKFIKNMDEEKLKKVLIALCSTPAYQAPGIKIKPFWHKG